MPKLTHVARSPHPAGRFAFAAQALCGRMVDRCWLATLAEAENATCPKCAAEALIRQAMAVTQ